MRNRETVLTYKEKNRLFIHMKHKVRIFCRTFGIYTKFLLLEANRQCNTPRRKQQTVLKKKSHILYIFYLHGVLNLS